MKFFTPLLILVSSLLCSETLIHAGKYIDVVNGKVISKSSIVIDQNGVIKEILISDAEPVEYGEALFVIEE